MKRVLLNIFLGGAALVVFAVILLGGLLLTQELLRI